MAKKQVNTSVEVTYTGIIYCYTSKTSGLKYIGQTTNESRRRQKFLSNSVYCTKNQNGGKLSHFDLARFKYGTDDFLYEVLITIISTSEEQLHSELNRLEKQYIEKYDTFNSGYNSTTGGNEGWLLSSETRKIMSAKSKERFANIENHPMYGRYHTEETKRKISEAKKGTHIGKDHHNSKAVLCYTKSGDFIQEFPSMSDAARFVDNPKAKAQGISMCCLGQRKTAYGYVWKFKV